MPAKLCGGIASVRFFPRNTFNNNKVRIFLQTHEHRVYNIIELYFFSFFKNIYVYSTVQILRYICSMFVQDHLFDLLRIPFKHVAVTVTAVVPNVNVHVS